MWGYKWNIIINRWTGQTDVRLDHHGLTDICGNACSWLLAGKWSYTWQWCLHWDSLDLHFSLTNCFHTSNTLCLSSHLLKPFFISFNISRYHKIYFDLLIPPSPFIFYQFQSHSSVSPIYSLLHVDVPFMVNAGLLLLVVSPHWQNVSGAEEGAR